MEEDYQICSRCVMDSSATNITFDEQGICNYCIDFEKSLSEKIVANASDKLRKLESLVLKIKEHGKGKPYDCIVGVSGGVDSSWVLVKAVEYGLRPLAVHMDNGWNSDLAESNINNLISELGVDLHRFALDRNEYIRLMKSFLDADVVDVELLYDNAMLSLNYREAKRYGVKHILSGSNQVSEGMRVPDNWNWLKLDAKNIHRIAERSHVALSRYPSISVMSYVKYAFINRIRWTSILDLIDYNKFEAMLSLQENYRYQPYPYKHYESIFTRFYQGHILVKKFGIDKRRLHHSSLIISGQMAREAALKDLESSPYNREDDLNSDMNYFLTKINWSKKDLDDYLKRPRVSHDTYGTDVHLWNFLRKCYKHVLKGVHSGL